MLSQLHFATTTAEYKNHWNDAVYLDVCASRAAINQIPLPCWRTSYEIINKKNDSNSGGATVGCHELQCLGSSGMFCWPRTSRTDTVQLSPANISAGADIPVGTVIYQGRWVTPSTGTAVMICLSPVDTSMWYNIAWSIESAPLPLSSWAGSPFGGAVYQTNIPGIGIAISRNNNSDAAILGQPNYQHPNDTENLVTGGSYEPPLGTRTLYVTLIKTGTIAPGNYTLNASSLPTASISITNPISHAATAGLPIKVYTIQFQGQLNISTQTCTTPDVDVYLGKFEKANISLE